LRRSILIKLSVITIAVQVCIVLMSYALFRDNRVVADGDQGSGTGAFAPSFDPTAQDSNYAAVLYNNTNGLPTSEANDITQTSDGALWIGSYSGLIRYDGSHFERMDSATGITSVTTLYADRNDRIWIGTNDNGIVIFNNGEVKKFGAAEGLGSVSVRSIVGDDNGIIYAGTTRGVVAFDSNDNLVKISDDRINDSYIRDLRMGAGNVCYGLTIEGAVFKMSDMKVTEFYSSDTLKSILVGDGITLRTILPDSNDPDYIYAGNGGSGLFHLKLTNDLSSNSSSRFYVAPLHHINSLTEIGNDIWVCSDDGIGVVDRNMRGLRIINDIPMNSSIDRMMIDYQGNYWFTSTRQGIMKIVPNQFTDVFDICGIENRVVNATCMYDGRLFIGTDSGLIVTENDQPVGSIPVTSAVSASGKQLKWADLVKVLNGIKIRSIIRDSQNRLWISTFGSTGLICFDGKTVTDYTTDDGLPSERVRTAIELSDGSYAAACTGGVAIIEEGKITRIYDSEEGISNTEVLTVCEATNGDILAGTDGGGIFVIGKDGNVRSIGVSEGLSSEVIMRIKRDRKKEIYWLITSNSLSYMDGNYKINTINNFPYSNNFDIVETDSEDMWILSSNGIYVVPENELTSGSDINALYYSMDNGLCCIATSNSYSDLTDTGDLYIAGTTGVAKVNVNKKMLDVSSLKMNVPYIDADGVIIFPDEDGRFNIDPSVTRVTIHPFIYTYSLINPQISYVLNGFDNKETTISSHELSPVVYTNLKGGEYNFKMRVTNPSSAYESDLSIFIVKPKAFYETLWFYVIMVIVSIAAVALVVALFFRGRLRKYEKKAEENKKLIREITEAFAKTIDMKDKYTNGHSTRVAEYTAKLARELGCSEEEITKYYNIALLHDIGKIGIPMEVLNKNGKLTDEEYACIKSHTTLGHDVLAGISIMPELATGAGSHHERPDGKGYPEGLKGDEIPRVAQIIAVADTFDAMYSDRPYRKRMNFDKAVSIIKDVSGTQLTGDVVDAFLKLVDRGELRAEDDHGGGTFDDINNIHKKFDSEGKKDPSA